jgi:hypothetical protein
VFAWQDEERQAAFDRIRGLAELWPDWKPGLEGGRPVTAGRHCPPARTIHEAGCPDEAETPPGLLRAE